MDSKLSLIIQLNGVFLLTILALFLRRSLKLTALKYWTVAWLALSFALICLRLAFDQEHLAPLLFTYYFLGQYVFGFMLLAGCRSLADGFTLQVRNEAAIVPFVIIAVGLPLASADFVQIHSIHSLIMAGFFGAAFLALRRAASISFGTRTMNIVLALLAAHSVLYFFVIQLRSLVDVPPEFSALSTVLDLVLQTTLGCGMVIVLLEKVVVDYQTANADLRLAQKRLEDLVHKDPLTAAFTRHAFYGFVNQNAETGDPVSGCVGFFDIDDLKAINDHLGHAAGDAAIRAVVRGIREIIRAEDLIYRWGGDEFFVIMISMSAEMAEARMARLERLLREIKLDDSGEPVTIAVSWGFTDFADLENLEVAITQADRQMYGRKRERKERRAISKDLVTHVEMIPGL